MQKEKNDLKIIFFGTPNFAATILETLLASGYLPLTVVTAPDKPVGRKQVLTPPPVKILAKKYDIPIFQPERIKNHEGQTTPNLVRIKNLKPDLIILAAYGQIIPKEILDIPKYGSLNIHPSLLPKYRGASPIQTAILNGDKETGVTIMLMDEKMDHGDIVANKKLKIKNKKYDYELLSKELSELGAKLLIEIIPKWINDKIKPKEQNHVRATFTKIIKKEDGKIDWSQSAEKIERMIRAYNPWPGTYTKIQNGNQNDRLQCKILKIYSVEIGPSRTKKEIGEMFLTKDKKLAVQTKKHCLIIKDLQLEGKNKMTAKEFLNGHPEIIGSILE